ncbi:MAG: hypothetical protein ACI9JE_001063 [Candidatus Krumholzibacteriia bacterium]|jgi:hypothetical protein
MHKFSTLGSFALIVAILISSTSFAQSNGSSSTATGFSRLMNPAISLNTLLLGEVSRDDSSPEANQFGLQEIELQFSSIVDPFWSADLIFAIHKEEAEHHEEGGEEEAEEGGHGGDYGLGVERALVEYTNMPRGWGLEVGLNFVNFGKHMPLHSHQYAFVEGPIGVTAFADEGNIVGTGATLSWLVPLPWWSEIEGYVVNSSNELFAEENRDLVFGGRLNNLWDTSSFSTLEWGFSGLAGPAPAPTTLAFLGDGSLLGTDLTWKWISKGRVDGPAINITGEALWPGADAGDGTPVGYYGLAQYRFHPGWWLGLGASQAQDYAGAGSKANQYQSNLTYAPSEFSSVRLGVSYDEDVANNTHDLSARLQVNFTIGSHPAHAY